MEKTKFSTMALMIATAVLGAGSPLAAMAQVPEEDAGDTNLSEGIGIPADVLDRLLDDRLDDIVAGTAELGPNVCQIPIQNPNPLIGTASICDIRD